MAASGAGRPGLALRAHRVAVQLHRRADERCACHQPGPAHGAGAFRAPDEPARRGAAARGARAGARRAQGRRAPVTVAAALVAYAAGLGILGSRMLARARWTARAPLLAIVTYLAAVWSVIAALGLAGLTLAVHATAIGGGLSDLIGACVHRLQATYGTPGGATVAGVGLTLAGAGAARTALPATTYLRVTGRQALHHAQTARLVGQPAPALGAVLVEHAQPAAYCVAGRQPTVILTTGAVQA